MLLLPLLLFVFALLVFTLLHSTPITAKVHARVTRDLLARYSLSRTACALCGEDAFCVCGDGCRSPVPRRVRTPNQQNRQTPRVRARARSAVSLPSCACASLPSCPSSCSPLGRSPSRQPREVRTAGYLQDSGNVSGKGVPFLLTHNTCEYDL